MREMLCERQVSLAKGAIWRFPALVRAVLVPWAKQPKWTDLMTELLKISLPDGSVREMEPGSTPYDVAAAIGPGLAKADHG